MGTVGQNITLERGSDSRLIVLPGANYRDEIPRVKSTDPMQIQGRYEKINSQLANIGRRNHGLRVSLRVVTPKKKGFSAHDDEDFSVEIALGREVELVVHGTDVVLVITPQ